MKKITVILLSLCWTSFVLAAEQTLKEIPAAQACPLLELLPDETLDQIVHNLIDSVSQATKKDEFENAIKTIAHLQGSCRKFAALLKDERYQALLEKSYKNTLKKLRSNLIDAVVEEPPNLFIIKMLIKTGLADINQQGRLDYTALIAAAELGHKDIVDLLINTGADLNKTTSDGRTALMFAAQNGHKDIVDLLINADADLNLKNNKGKTALDLAIENNNTEITMLLKDALQRRAQTPAETSARN